MTGGEENLIKEEYDLEYNIRTYNTDFTYIHI